jgi:FixJ family two-component response regulator
MTRRLIVVIDDDANMRDGLEAFLSREFDVRCFASAKAFLAARESVARPHCILLDLRMPEMDGLALQEALRSSAPRPPIIFMSGDADKSDIIEAWRGGAANFILKPFSADEIRESIQALWERATVVEPTHSPDLPITRREAQVLLLLGQGLQQSEAAEKLGLSLRTIKMYRSFLRDKLKLKSPIEIGRFYDQHRGTIAQIAGSQGPEV